MLSTLVACLLLGCAVAIPTEKATDEEIRTISSQIWAADTNRITGSDVVYNPNGPKLFTYVNEARLTGTYALMLALRDNYTPEVGIAETCGAPCDVEIDAFLDGILATQPIQLLHQWLVSKGLASADTAGFKEELRQYWFMKYTRSGGPLGSDGFEHIFVGEIKNNEVSGSHNWVNWYFEEKDGHFVYGNLINECDPEIMSFSFRWLGYNKPISGSYFRTSPEVEIALATLCLLARMGSSCPVRLDGIQSTLTVWDMTGIPTTIGSAYPNC